MSQFRDEKKITDLLKALDIFPNTKTVRQLRSELKSAREIIQKRKRREVRRQVAKEREIERSKISRSNKLKKHHHYIRLIKDNVPDVPYNDIRRMLKARKEGKEVSIPDVIWQNPSP